MAIKQFVEQELSSFDSILFQVNVTLIHLMGERIKGKTEIGFDARATIAQVDSATERLNRVADLIDYDGMPFGDWRKLDRAHERARQLVREILFLEKRFAGETVTEKLWTLEAKFRKSKTVD